MIESLLLIVGAFIGGVVSSVSPCAIAILPLILAYICGSANKSNKEIAIKLISFSLGLSTVMGLFGLFCAVSGQVFGSFASPIVIIIFGSILMTLGLQLVGFIDLPTPTIIKKIPQNNSTGLFWYPFLIGVIFAFLASPCSTPILVAIMTIATASKNYLTSFLMLFAFAFGQCIIIILAGLFASFLTKLQQMQKYTGVLLKVAGAIFILFAMYLWTTVYLNILTYNIALY